MGVIRDYRRRWPRRRRWWRARWAQRLIAAVAIVGAIGVAQLLDNPSAPSFQVAAQEPSSVRLRVIDGDTYEVRESGERIRQANIDTPETGGRERCAAEREAGERATREARRLIARADRVSIRRTGREDRYGRTIGFVSVDGRDLGEILIERGLARPWRGRREQWCGPQGELLPP